MDFFSPAPLRLHLGDEEVEVSVGQALDMSSEDEAVAVSVGHDSGLVVEHDSDGRGASGNTVGSQPTLEGWGGTLRTRGVQDDGVGNVSDLEFLARAVGLTFSPTATFSLDDLTVKSTGGIACMTHTACRRCPGRT